jgi:preprotein translocase subunit SecY
MDKILQLLRALFGNLFAERTPYEDEHGPDRRHRVLNTVLLLLAFRVLAELPALNVDEERLQHLLADNPFLGLVDLFAGGEVLRHFSWVAAGILPYLAALGLAQGATWVVPSLRDLRDQGEKGKKQIKLIATVVSVPLAIIFAYAISRYLARQTGLFPGNIHWFTSETFFPSMRIVCLVTLGSVLSTGIINWITRKGIGSGENIVLLAGASLALAKQISDIVRDAPDPADTIQRLAIVVVGAAVFAVLGFWLVKAQRTLTVFYPKRRSDSRLGGESLVTAPMPLLLISGGYVPVSAAIGLLALLRFAPTVLEAHFEGTLGAFGKMLGAWLTPESDWFWAALACLIVLFTYARNFAVIWPGLSKDDLSVAEFMKKNGTFFSGVSPGIATETYLSRIVAQNSLLGSLGMVLLAAGLPYLIFRITQKEVLVGVLSLIVLVKTVDRVWDAYKAFGIAESYDGLLKKRRTTG